jgi:hypothetical protein
MPVSVYVRALLKAAEVVGGRKKLARHLQAPLPELEKWIAGSAIPPEAAFHKAVEIILDGAPGREDPGRSPPCDAAGLGGSATWC